LILRSNNKKVNWDNLADSLNSSYNLFLQEDSLFMKRRSQIFNKNNFFKNLDLSGNIQNNNGLYHYNDYVEITRFSRRSQGTNNPVRLIKYPISNKTNFDFGGETVELFRFRFNDSEQTAKQKPASHSTFLTLKQKRYKRKKVILPRNFYVKDEKGDKTKQIKYSSYPYLHQNKIILNDFDNATRQYRMIRKNKARYELTNLVLSKRIIRTRRTLVLPAHVNITAITNSYDVMHS